MKDSLKSVANAIPEVIGIGMKDFLFLHRVEMGVLIVIAALILNILLRLKWTKDTIVAMIDDTLKVDDEKGKRRFSGTKLTMVTAFGSVLWAFHYIIIKYGFNETAFITMAAIATGVGITKAFSKKLDPTITAPDKKTDTTTENTGG
jgi:hypothetical protein